MFGTIKNVLGSLKEKSAELSVAAYLNQKIKAFGQVSKLEINSENRMATIEVELKGEPTPIWVRVDSFELAQEQGKTWIIVKQVTASREWIGLALQQYIIGERFEVPEAAAWVLRK